MIVRRHARGATREQLLHFDSENLHEVIELKIQDELQPRLDLGDATPGDVPSCTLQFNRELRLRPMPSVSEPPHLGADDVVVFQEFCAFPGAKLGGRFHENGSAHGAAFQRNMQHNRAGRPLLAASRKARTKGSAGVFLAFFPHDPAYAIPLVSWPDGIENPTKAPEINTPNKYPAVKKWGHSRPLTTTRRRSANPFLQSPGRWGQSCPNESISPFRISRPAQ